MVTSKAFRLHSYGGPECITLDDVEVPTPGPLQVLVKVHAVGMNPFDWKIRDGYVKEILPLPLPAVLGVDFAGTVVAVGAGASRFEVGDRVMAMSRSLGAFAEHIVVNESILGRVPAELSDTSAATLPIPVTTAWQTLHAAGNVGPAMQVLIHGASGIVGAFAIQFAKAAGAKVFATASAKNRNYVMSLGADEFIDYQTERFEDRVKNIDLVLDYVLVGGADNTIDRSWKVLKSDGALVSAADPSMTARVPAGSKGYAPEIVPDGKLLETIAKGLVDGTFKSKIARVFERDDLLEAMEINKAGGTTGRLVVAFRRP